MLRRIALNSLLLCSSLVVSLVLVELSLRFVFPRYEQAAGAQYDPGLMTAWAPRANRRGQVPHPDTGIRHPVIHNELAMRQSRNFENLSTATNIAFFGDSYTANLGLPSAYSFTEPLDYLLNRGRSQFNVLNFGVNGYGTDQSYLRYLGFPAKEQLHHVFYVLCANDLRNIYETNLFALDPAGRLTRNPPARPPWWIRTISRFHLTYLALDIRQRVLYARTGGIDEYRLAMERVGMRRQQKERFHSEKAEEVQSSFLEERSSEPLEQTLAVFEQILQDWRRAVENNGGQFHIVLLPTGREELFKNFLPSDFDVISLYELLEESMGEYRWSDLQFRNDGHWAEKGNMLAARHLYRFVERELDIEARTEDWLNAEVATYYSAFPGGWMPTDLATTVTAPAEDLAGIRSKYLALEIAAP